MILWDSALHPTAPDDSISRHFDVVLCELPFLGSPCNSQNDDVSPNTTLQSLSKSCHKLQQGFSVVINDLRMWSADKARLNSHPIRHWSMGWWCTFITRACNENLASIAWLPTWGREDQCHPSLNAFPAIVAPRLIWMVPSLYMQDWWRTILVDQSMVSCWSDCLSERAGHEHSSLHTEPKNMHVNSHNKLESYGYRRDLDVTAADPWAKSILSNLRHKEG